MARKNPSVSKDSKDLDRVMDGIDNLPNPIGVNMDAVEDANKMPGHGSLGVTVSMSPNDGGKDSDKRIQSAFANGTDGRNYTPRGPKSDPTPAMPGA